MSNMFPILLAANIGDLLSALVPVVIFVIWVVGQIANRKNQAPAKPVRRAQRRAADDWANDQDKNDDVVVAQAAGDGEKKTVFDEIEQFLARARQQTKQAQPPPPLSQKPIVAQPIVAEVAGAKTVEPRRGLGGDLTPKPVRFGSRERIADSVNETVDTSDITAGIDALGDAVEIADDVMEAHLREVFDHRLGSLQQVAAETPASRLAASNAQKRAAGQRVGVPPVDFAAMLANTGSLRKAIVLNEILQRPADRW